ncbi:Xaa-Pro peptidase family protein [Mesorhizobium sp. M0676]|uniref:M24 family metallopeptidase n=1 Tax=Mesorhizobium sp. M0676 TaxID=2956984 RepID=UPI0033386228
MDRNPFSEAEIAGRLARVRTLLGERNLDAAVFASPENVFYLTGLDHWGYFTPHLLVVAQEGQPVLVTRANERWTIENRVKAAAFRSHSDSQTAADVAALVLADMGLSGKQIGLEYWTAGLSHGLAVALQSQTDAKWSDVSGLVDKMRRVKSAEEQALMRRAAKVTDAAAGAAIAAISDGASEQEVAADCMSAMIRAGGHVPGFGPFIRPGARLRETHATWGDGVYRKGEPVLIELSGCVSRYHAPLGRLVHIGDIKGVDIAMAEVNAKAFDAVVKALRPGAIAREVFAAWRAVVDDAGLSHYYRHHCGYMIGVGQPPSWTGGNSVIGLRPDSDIVIETGMSFHILSWLMGTGRGDDFVSNTVLLGDGGAELLTLTPAGPIVR